MLLFVMVLMTREVVVMVLMTREVVVMVLMTRELVVHCRDRCLLKRIIYRHLLLHNPCQFLTLIDFVGSHCIIED